MKRYLLILFLLAVLVVAALIVPINGRTLWQRVQGPAPSTASEASGTGPGATEGGAAKKQATVAKGGAAADKDAVGDEPDLHSDEERQALDDLIERKLKAAP